MKSWVQAVLVERMGSGCTQMHIDMYNSMIARAWIVWTEYLSLSGKNVERAGGVCGVHCSAFRIYMTPINSAAGIITCYTRTSIDCTILRTFVFKSSAAAQEH